MRIALLLIYLPVLLLVLPLLLLSVVLTPAERKIEELVDIERGLELVTKELAAAERKVERWGISSEERARLRSEIGTLKSTLQRLEEARAMRL